MKILCYTGFFCFVCFVFCVDNSSEITHVASSSRVLEQDLSYPGELPPPCPLALFFLKKLYEILVLLALPPPGLEEAQSTEHLKHGCFRVLLETMLPTGGTSPLLTKWKKKS